MADTGFIRLSESLGSPTTSTSGSGTNWVPAIGATWFETASALSAGSSTRFLNITNPAPTFPGGAVLTGVQAVLARDTDDYDSEVLDSSIKLIVAGSAVGSNKALGTNWGDADGTYGGDGDLWGVTGLVIADVVASGFGIQISAQRPSDGDPSNYPLLTYVDFKFFYTIAAATRREVIQYS